MSHPIIFNSRLTVWLAVSLLASSSMVRAVTPPPDGGYVNFNTAEGDNALLSLTNGSFNSAVGFDALLSNTTGNQNTATGAQVLQNNTTGTSNTATGYTALQNNTSGGDNTADGVEALFSNTSGNNNTATGLTALAGNTTGSKNTAIGFHALFDNTTGDSNTAAGFNALLKSTGSFNIALGNNAGSKLTTGFNNIDIGNTGVKGEGKTIRIGTTGTHQATFIAGINGVVVAGGVGVIVDADGQLGTSTSSARFKDEIRPMNKASEAIYQLTPVTFRYKKELDPNGIPQFGLIAEEVEKIDSGLVARGEDGKAYTVRYEAVNAMLLNEFLKEHRKVEEQGATIAEMKKLIEALTATVQRVNERIDFEKSLPPTFASQ